MKQNHAKQTFQECIVGCELTEGELADIHAGLGNLDPFGLTGLSGFGAGTFSTGNTTTPGVSTIPGANTWNTNGATPDLASMLGIPGGL